MNTGSLITIFISGKLVTLKSTKNSVQLKVLNDWTEMSFNDLITEGNFIIISFTNCHVQNLSTLVRQ